MLRYERLQREQVRGGVEEGEWSLAMLISTCLLDRRPRGATEQVVVKVSLDFRRKI